MKYFGPFTPSDEMERVDTPVGKSCIHCDERIDPLDVGYVFPPNDSLFHRACFMRGVLGSVAHQQHRCLCYGGTEEDDPALTTRQAAEAALEYYRRKLPWVRP
jgi:hypothetical protein